MPEDALFNISVPQPGAGEGVLVHKATANRCRFQCVCGSQLGGLLAHDRSLRETEKPVLPDRPSKRPPELLGGLLLPPCG